MLQKTLPRYLGGSLLILIIVCFLGANRINAASSRTQVSAIQGAATPMSGSHTNSMRGSSGTARPDTFIDQLLTGMLVMLTAILCVSLLIAQRRRERKHLLAPETDPALPGVPAIGDDTTSSSVLSTEEFPVAQLPAPDASRVLRLKNRLRTM